MLNTSSPVASMLHEYSAPLACFTLTYALCGIGIATQALRFQLQNRPKATRLSRVAWFVFLATCWGFLFLILVPQVLGVVSYHFVRNFIMARRPRPHIYHDRDEVVGRHPLREYHQIPVTSSEDAEVKMRHYALRPPGELFWFGPGDGLLVVGRVRPTYDGPPKYLADWRH